MSWLSAAPPAAALDVEEHRRAQEYVRELQQEWNEVCEYRAHLQRLVLEYNGYLIAAQPIRADCLRCQTRLRELMPTASEMKSSV